MRDSKKEMIILALAEKVFKYVMYILSFSVAFSLIIVEIFDAMPIIGFRVQLMHEINRTTSIIEAGIIKIKIIELFVSAEHNSYQNNEVISVARSKPIYFRKFDKNLSITSNPKYGNR